LLLFLEANIKL